MKKTIIINWRWTSTSTEKSKKLLIEKESQVVFCWYFENDLGKFKSTINGIKSDEILILLHRGNGVLPEHLIDTRFFKVGFGGGEEPVYDAYGGFIDTDEDYKDIDKSFNEVWNNKDENIERFELVWNKYYIIGQKKKLINLWLPLAIDIQGLSEVEDAGIREEYYNDIRLELLKNNKEYYSFISEEWNNLKKNLKNSNVDLNILNKLLERIKDTNDGKNFYNDFIHKKEQFLPNILKRVVEELNTDL